MEETNAPLQEVLRDLEEDSGAPISGEIKQRLVTAFRGEVFSGPLPHPEILVGYEQATPGSAERIISMAEKQADHRRVMESKLLDADIRSEQRGQIMAFSLATLVSGGGIYLLAIGQDIGGLVALITPLAGLAGMFIAARRQPKDKSNDPSLGKGDSRKSLDSESESSKQDRD